MRQGLRPSDTEVARNARHGMLEDDLWFIYDLICDDFPKGSVMYNVFDWWW